MAKAKKSGYQSCTGYDRVAKDPRGWYFFHPQGRHVAVGSAKWLEAREAEDNNIRALQPCPCLDQSPTGWDSVETSHD